MHWNYENYENGNPPPNCKANTEVPTRSIEHAEEEGTGMGRGMAAGTMTAAKSE